MRDERKWRLAVAEFQAIRDNIPSHVSEPFVHDYHAVLDKMAEATEDNLDSFRIPATELKPRVVSAQIGSRHHPGNLRYSPDNYCDSNLFQRKVDALTRYLPSIEDRLRQPQVPDDSKDYWAMSTIQLEMLARRYNIDGYGDKIGHTDRSIIIKALLQRDEKLQSARTIGDRFVNYGTISNSNVQQGSSGSTAKINHPIDNQIALATRIRKAIPQLTLTNEQQNILETDLTTVELQLRSGSPKTTILNECWHSVRNILEGLTGNVIAAGVLHELMKLPH